MPILTGDLAAFSVQSPDGPLELPMAGKKRDRPSWIRFSGVGVEFALVIGGFAAVGYWIDLHYGCGPWGLVIGAVLGLIGGTYNLVRESLTAFQPREPPDRREDKGQRHEP